MNQLFLRVGDRVYGHDTLYPISTETEAIRVLRGNVSINYQALKQAIYEVEEFQTRTKPLSKVTGRLEAILNHPDFDHVCILEKKPNSYFTE